MRGAPSAIEILRMSKKSPDGGGMDSPDDMDYHDPDEGLRSATEDLFAAFEKKDVDAGMRALKAAFQLCDSEPHEEGEHEDGGEDDNFANGGIAGMGPPAKSERSPMVGMPRMGVSINGRR